MVVWTISNPQKNISISEFLQFYDIINFDITCTTSIHNHSIYNIITKL